MEYYHPDILKYYEDRRTGKIEEKSFEEWGVSINEKGVKRLKNIATSKVRHTFFAMDYSHGFTGRGGLRTPCTYIMRRYTYRVIVLPDAMERPGLIGPWDERVEELVRHSGQSTREQISDETDEEDADRLGEPRNEEVRPVGELRNDEEEETDSFFGGPRDEDDGLYDDQSEKEEEEEEQQQQEEEEEEEKEEKEDEEDEEDDDEDEEAEDDEGEPEECGSPENMEDLMQLAASSVATISRVSAIAGDATSPHAATTSSREPWVPSTPSRKRARNSADDVEDEESSLRQKRMRMDEAFGITRINANAAEVPQHAGAAMIPSMQQPGKRSRSLDDDSEDDLPNPNHKRPRLYERPKEIRDVEEEYISAGQADTAENDDATLVCQDTTTIVAQEASIVDEAPGETEVCNQPSVEHEPSNAEGEVFGEDAPVEDGVAPTEERWDTAHGINSNDANIHVPGNNVYVTTGELRPLFLPTSTGSPDRPWTEEEKEDLRVYIQDYGILDWAILSQSTNRPEEELQYMYFEVVTARNVQAGRPEDDGIPEAYPDLAPAPPPVPAAPPLADVPRQLRSLNRIWKAKRNNLGDLTYDVKATSFPKVTRDGGMVDSRGNALLGIMSDISHTTQRRQKKPVREGPKSLPSADHSHNIESSHVKHEESESEIEEGEIMEEEESVQQRPAPSPPGSSLRSKKKGL